jgi:Holliday junction DNA helicase RuvA
MIGKIRGKLISKFNDYGLIETKSGIAFWVNLGEKKINNLPLKSILEVYTFLQVTEENFILYGFDSLDQYQLFHMLLQVNSVGPRIAHHIATFASKEQIIKAVKENDIFFFTKIPSVGKKIAARIILELSAILKNEIATKNLIFTDEDKLLIQTLKKLGFSPDLINRIYKKIPKDLDLEQRLKIALKIIKDEKL